MIMPFIKPHTFLFHLNNYDGYIGKVSAIIVLIHLRLEYR